jgi:ADP-L-glycero-D-manno-heptose 6-epimerase
MIVVTGGAGFIGSALIHELNTRGRSDLLVVDDLDHEDKKKNLAVLKFSHRVGKDAFIESVLSRTLAPPEAILHLGACSSTTETDWNYLKKNNLDYTRHLAEFAMENGVRFIYASSAATYGDGEQGYNDDESTLELLKPLNLYGESKHKFDLWAREQGVLKTLVGLKYFNVYGPNEYHKMDMQSLVRKGYYQIRETGGLKLFKSHRDGYGDGEPERDFLYIKDAVAMTLFFLERPEVAGLFNIGSGRARNWNDLARAVFKAMGLEPRIEYIDMPEKIRDRYQYHTLAEMGKLQHAGYTSPARSIEDGIDDYVKNYLIPGRRLGEE